jgi:uncharacterized membrane protein
MGRVWNDQRIRSYLARRSLLGAGLGTIFFAASLTPSLAPRPPVLLGALGGASFAMGYLFGLILLNVWAYLGLSVRRASPRVTQIILAVCALAAAGYLWFSIDWQNDVRTVLRMEPLSRWQLIETAMVAVITFVVLFAIGIGIREIFRRATRLLDRFMPRRLAILLGVVLAVLLSWTIINGLIFRTGLHLADSSFRELDSLMQSDLAQPTDTLQAGSPQSLIAWKGLGRQGRRYIASGPTQQEISQLSGGPATQPVRVYAGLNSAGTAEERASLALTELKRVGGFEKPVLVVIAPTGTGWVDGAAIDTLEYLHHGDVASVAIQYSYLASWLSLLVEPDYGVDSARALFRQVYNHWKTLPRESRPRLYLYGLSLGALSSERSMDLFDVIDDPIQGALWAGPPFPSPLWQTTTRDRQSGSPVWLPRFRDSSVVRFTNQENHLTIPGAEWGRMRIVYLQYGSDPITFFTPSSFYQQPEWMTGHRAPDVSPSFRWVPGVTFLQLGVDMITGMETPPGFGHVFAADHYMDAWIAVTQPTGWTDADLTRLRGALVKAQAQARD